MAKTLVKLGLKRQPGLLYFIGKDGGVWQAPMNRGGVFKGKKARVTEAGLIKKEAGNLYFLSKTGDIAVAKMNRN